WRSNVTGIPKALLKVLCDHGLSRQDLSRVLKGYFDGKCYYGFREGEDFTVSAALLEQTWQELSPMLEQVEMLRQQLYEKIRHNEKGIRKATMNNNLANKAFGALLDDPETFANAIGKARTKQYVIKLYKPLVEIWDEIDGINESVCNRSRELISRLYHWSIQLAGANIADFKSRNSVLSFDDMITNLHQAVVTAPNEFLLKALQQKYKAIFVDEFQDTDKMQYEIFRQAFQGDTILFYIGDPKQSIYGWRKADISTYLKAGREVTTRYSMNINYRSCADYIAAMNQFFLPSPGFDTFGFDGKDDGFQYVPVEASEKSHLHGLIKNGIIEAPLKVLECRNNGEITGALAAQVLDLLEDTNWQLPDGDQLRAVRPSDIGILVRTNKQGREIKGALARKGIPAINIDEAKILGTEEAKWMLYLLQAMNEPNRGSINKALLSPLTGYDREQLLKLNEEELQKVFRSYGESWDGQGIYVAMLSFLRDFKVRGTLLNGPGGQGERTLANLMQLLEILHKTQTGNKFNNVELMTWLQKGTEGMEVEGDEFEQRVESDEEAVRIITIHKSKGLEYPIVFAPFLDLLPDDKRDFCSFRDPGSGEYIFAQKHQLDAGQTTLLQNQSEQENRRLIYVAITRAVFGSFVYRNTYYRTSGLSPFVNTLKTVINTGDPIQLTTADNIQDHKRYSGKAAWKPLTPDTVDHFTLEDIHWHKLSYTFLAKKQPHVPRDNSHAHHDAYDLFVFKQLTKGILTGNMLHYMLEKIDFSTDKHWDRIIAAGIRRFMPGASANYGSMIRTLLDYITRVPISLGNTRFTLSEVPRQKRVSELEFDFQVDDFMNTDLLMLSSDRLRLEVGFEQRLAGMMNGKIDLVFEHGGRYYILDWKSNFLGDESAYYTVEQLEEAMNESNYHLQYLLYTLALKRYLSVKLPSFDYEKDFGGVIYMFLRGIRPDGQHGIFTARPALEQIGRLEGILKNEGQQV
ncbi:MAG TPA: UvrD-helicase domain-containing protein, partial [Chitinophagaceae bacterium]|nr:UvrD-helicase domain-containing protein [Chitinophagaceae bacterium]